MSSLPHTTRESNVACMNDTSSEEALSVLVHEHGPAIERWVLAREELGAANRGERSNVVVCKLKATQPAPVIGPGG